MMRGRPRSLAAASSLATIVTLLAIAAFGCVLAYWTWVWIGPREQPRAPAWTGARTGTSAVALFGTPSHERAAVGLRAASVRLIGVAAGSRKTAGYALVQLGSAEIVVVREGSEMEPGVRLLEVHPDSIVLERAGSRETVEWPQAGVRAQAAAPKVAAPAAPLPARTPVASPPPDVASQQQPVAGAVLGRAPTKAERDRLSD